MLCLVMEAGMNSTMSATQRKRAPRRLAAILAADVAGYSRLMGEDEAGTARVTNAALMTRDRRILDYAARGHLAAIAA